MERAKSFDDIVELFKNAKTDEEKSQLARKYKHEIFDHFCKMVDEAFAEIKEERN